MKFRNLPTCYVKKFIYIFHIDVSRKKNIYKWSSFSRSVSDIYFVTSTRITLYFDRNARLAPQCVLLGCPWLYEDEWKGWELPGTFYILFCSSHLVQHLLFQKFRHWHFFEAPHHCNTAISFLLRYLMKKMISALIFAKYLSFADPLSTTASWIGCVLVGRVPPEVIFYCNSGCCETRDIFIPLWSNYAIVYNS